MVDGHHRVSVAHEQGQVFIDAEVRECLTKINITPDLKPEDLEILGEKVNFLERTGLDRICPGANIKLTISDILKEFPGKTEGDLYLWVLDNQRHLSQAGRNLQPPEEAARKFVQGVE